MTAGTAEELQRPSALPRSDRDILLQLQARQASSSHDILAAVHSAEHRLETKLAARGAADADWETLLYPALDRLARSEIRHHAEAEIVKHLDDTFALQGGFDRQFGCSAQVFVARNRGKILKRLTHDLNEPTRQLKRLVCTLEGKDPARYTQMTPDEVVSAVDKYQTRPQLEYFAAHLFGDDDSYQPSEVDIQHVAHILVSWKAGKPVAIPGGRPRKKARRAPPMVPHDEPVLDLEALAARRWAAPPDTKDPDTDALPAGSDPPASPSAASEQASSPSDRRASASATTPRRQEQSS